MAIFNLKKRAQANEEIINNRLSDQNNDFNTDNESTGVDKKNINFSLSTKDKDNTIPYETQIEAEREEGKSIITEKKLENKEKLYNDKRKKGSDSNIMDINVLSESFDQKKLKDYKEAEEKKDTDFWDKYIGVQSLIETNKVDNNISSSSQLQNNPDRFNNTDHKPENIVNHKVKKMVFASLKDADAMLFHIYATAKQKNRELNNIEKQQIIDINSGKRRLFTISGDPTVKKNKNGTFGVYEVDGVQIDEFKSCEEAKANYPEVDTKNR